MLGNAAGPGSVRAGKTHAETVIFEESTPARVFRRTFPFIAGLLTASSTLSYCDRDGLIVCCIIGPCQLVCLRNRICAKGSLFPVRFLSTREEGARADQIGSHAPRIDAICISASLKGLSKYCFASSSLNYCTFEYGAKLLRFRAGSLVRTDLKCLCLPASISRFHVSTFAIPSNLTILLEKDHRFFRISDGLLIATQDWSAFRQFGTREEMFIPNAIQTISACCFEATTRMKRVRFEPVSRVVKIGERAFLKCCHLTAICIPASVRRLCHSAFFECLGLQKLTFEGNSCLEVIEKSCFASCKALRKVVLPASLRISETRCNLPSIGDEVFAGCTSLCSITIPSSIAFLGQLCFSGCVKLCTIEFELGSKLTQIATKCFSGCRALKSFQVPRSIEKLGVEWFAGCTALASVNFEIGCRVSEIPGDLFARNQRLQAICISASVLVLCRSCFSHCSGLSSVTFELPSKLCRIEIWAFACCDSLTSIVLPESIETIEALAFSSCSSLADVIIDGHGSIRNVDADGFHTWPLREVNPIRRLCGSSYALNMMSSSSFDFRECEYDYWIGYDQALMDLCFSLLPDS
jgi:hypothetical protein